MQTEILGINEKSLNLAKNIILSGRTVVFPTETVYGLGANAYDEFAVESIFNIKGRPNDNPLIAHVHKDYDISELVSYVPEYAKILAKAFLPGPLTMVYKSRGTVCPAVSCGLDTLAIRIPSHNGAQSFLRKVGVPIAAPSANISKHVSPTSAEHVYNDLKGRVELILDGGSCSGGIESTVLDCTGDVPIILRSGLISREMIEDKIGVCRVHSPKAGERVLSPGMKYRHYTPDCATMLCADVEEALKAYEGLTDKEYVYFMCEDGAARKLCGKNILNLGKTDIEIAANLYAKLREGEKKARLIIGILPEMRDGIMAGVINRFIKACGN